MELKTGFGELDWRRGACNPKVKVSDQDLFAWAWVNGERGIFT